MELKELTYGIHTKPRIRIVRGRDYGPATKYLAPIARDMAANHPDADRTALVIIDDDTKRDQINNVIKYFRLHRGTHVSCEQDTVINDITIQFVL